MSAMLQIPPAAEPLTLAEAKAYLRVEHDAEDDLIAALVTAARGHVETSTRRALITQTWRIVRNAWPVSGCIAVLPAPLQEVVAARVIDAAGDAVEIGIEGFVVDVASVPGAVSWSGVMPAPGRHAGIEIDVSVGYGHTPEEVPEPLRQAVRLLLAHYYENRGVAAIGAGVALLPANVSALIVPYRVLSL